MNINVNIRIKTKLVEKLKWYTYKIATTLAANYPIFQTWYQIKNKTWSFDQNDKIYELSNLNIHEYQ